MSIDRGMDKEGMVYTYIVEYHSAIKKNEIRPFAATCMDRESVILSGVSQTEEKCYMTSLTCGMFEKMMQMNLQTERGSQT